MKKVLIWDCFPLANTGGPAGYLYNIYRYLQAHPSDQLRFLSDIWKIKQIPEKNKHISFFTRIKNRIMRIIGIESYFFRRNKILDFTLRQFSLPLESYPSVDLINEYDFIHFHSIVDFARFKSTYTTYQGKTILTSHCPCPVVDEMLTYWEPFCKPYRSKALVQECKCYAEADYLMFPCAEAREPYEKEVAIKKTFSKEESKFFYVPSAILDIEIDKETIQKYAELGIPEETFVITYFGRHNFIKGYDVLKEVGKRLLDKYPNMYFLCAGVGELKPLEHERWLELGFIKNAHELMYQSDLYILPNRETYFDLVVLENLRSGVPMIMSDTGGNKHFKKYPKDEVEGLSFYEDGDIKSLIEKVEYFIQLKKQDRDAYTMLRNKNRQLYLKYFTIGYYIDNYINEINKL